MFTVRTLLAQRRGTVCSSRAARLVRTSLAQGRQGSHGKMKYRSNLRSQARSRAQARRGRPLWLTPLSSARMSREVSRAALLSTVHRRTASKSRAPSLREMSQAVPVRRRTIIRSSSPARRSWGMSSAARAQAARVTRSPFIPDSRPSTIFPVCRSSASTCRMTRGQAIRLCCSSASRRRISAISISVSASRETRPCCTGTMSSAS